MEVKFPRLKSVVVIAGAAILATAAIIGIGRAAVNTSASGFAWNDHFGWVSFNCADLGPGACGGAPAGTITFGPPAQLGTQLYTDTATLDATHFVVAYCPANTSPNPCATRIGTVNGDIISYGPETQLTGGINNARPLVAALDSTHVVVIYPLYQSIDGRVQANVSIGTVSGTAISFGPVSVFAALNLLTTSIGTLNSSQVVITFQSSTGYVFDVVGTVNGNTISWGQLYSNNSARGQVLRYSLAVIDPAHFVVVYKQYPQGDGASYIGTISGSSISYGSIYSFRSTPTSDAQMSAVAVLDPSHFVVAYLDSSLPGGVARLGTISGSTIAFGAEYLLQNTNSLWMPVLAGIDSSHVILGYANNAINSNAFRLGSVSGTTVTFGLEYTSGGSINLPSLSVLDATHFVSASYSGMTVIGTLGPPPGAQYSVSVTDGATANTKNLTGYAWSENIGWLKLDCADTGGASSCAGQTTLPGDYTKPIIFGAPATFSPTAANGSDYSARLDATHLVSVYSDTQSSPRKGMAVVGTISGSTVTYTTPAAFSNDSQVMLITALDSTHVAIVYQECSSNPSNCGSPSLQQRVVVGTVSGFNITFGSFAIISSPNPFSWGFASLKTLDSTHVVLVVSTTGLPAPQGIVMVGVFNGSIISFGTPVSISTDANNYYALDVLDSTHFVVAYNNSPSVLPTSRSGLVKIGTITGTAITLGSGTTYTTPGDTSAYSNKVVVLDGTHFALAYNDIHYDGSSILRNGRVLIGTVAASVITFGSAYLMPDFSASNDFIAGLVAMDSNHVVLGYSGSDNLPHAIFGTASAGAFTFSSAYNFSAAFGFTSSSPFDNSMLLLDPTHFLTTGATTGNVGAAVIGVFQGQTIPGYPEPPNHGVQVDMASYRVTGWARACSVFSDPNACAGALASDSRRGGWDGWVKFGPVFLPAPDTSKRKVFATKNTYQGNLGGLTGANTICQSAATAAGLSGTWAAWASNGTTSATTNIGYQSTYTYYLADGTTLVASPNTLTSGTLAHAINMDEYKNPVTGDVWTGIKEDGVSQTLPPGSNCGSTTNYTNCSKWASNASATTGSVGTSTASDYQWSSKNSTYQCSYSGAPAPNPYSGTHTYSVSQLMCVNISGFPCIAYDLGLTYSVYGCTYGVSCTTGTGAVQTATYVCTWTCPATYTPISTQTVRQPYNLSCDNQERLYCFQTSPDSTDVGVYADPATCDLRGFAYAGDMAGWLPVNCKDVAAAAGKACAANVTDPNTQLADFKVTLPPSVCGLNKPPNAPANLNVNYVNGASEFCSAASWPMQFTWAFSDPDPGDYQNAAQVQVSTDQTFTNPAKTVFDSGKLTLGLNVYFHSFSPAILPYGGTYYWRLSFWDSHDAQSAWTIAGQPLAVPSHTLPQPAFTWSPQKISPYQTVTFDGSATVFNPAAVNKTYQYSFTGGQPMPPFTQPDASPLATAKFASASSTITATLTAADDAGSCQAANTINTTKALPKWREINPADVYRN